MKLPLPQPKVLTDRGEQSNPVSRLHDFCGGLMEACWLAAVVIVPLAYNPHGVAGFQPFKMSFVRAIALVLACAWVVRAIEGAKCSRPVSTKQRPSRLWIALWAGVGLLALMQVVASIFSVDPAQSWWGFSANRSGMVSFGSELVIFAAVASHLRSEAQWDRLTAAIIVPTIPIGVFAIAQSLGFDPLSIDRENIGAGRGWVSLAGHQISLAAHLGMVIPFTLVRVIDPWRAEASRSRSFSQVVYGAVLFLQITAVGLSKSRGPILAILGAVVTLAVAWAVLARSRTLFRRSFLAAIGVAAFLVTLSIPGGPLAPLTRLPVLDRMALAVPVGNTPDPFRTRLWQSAPDALLADAPFVFPGGQKDLSPQVRSAIGFGPESLQGVLPRYWTWIDPVKRLEKSYHNLFWDSWFSFGLIGTAALLFLFLGGMLLSFRPPGSRLGKRAAAAGLLGGSLICVALVMRFGAGYLGLGLQAGLVAGVVTALGCFVLFPPKGDAPPAPRTGAAFSTVAAGAAIAGHLIETAFAFPVAATSLLFWTCIGMVTAGAIGRRQTAAGGAPPTLGLGRPWALPVIATFVSMSLMFSFVSQDFLQPMSWGDILSSSLTRIPGTGAASRLISMVLLPTLVLLGSCAAAEAGRHGGRKWPAFLKTIAAAFFPAAGYAVFKACHIAAIGPLPGPLIPTGDIVRQAVRMESVVMIFFVLGGVLLGVLGWACCRKREPSLPAFSWPGVIAASLLAPAVVAAAHPLCLRFVLADTAYGAANLRAGSPDLNTRQAGVEMLQRAIQYDPFAYEYRLRFADACLALAAEMDLPRRNAILDRAVRVLSDGHAISPLNPISYALARLHMTWALSEPLPPLQKVRATEARKHFAEALHFDPMADHIWVESAAVDGGLLGDHDSEAAKLRSAASLVDPHAAREWAEAYARWSVHAGHPLLQRRYAERGIFHFRTAIESATRAGASKFLLLLGKGTLHRNLGQFEEARADLQAAAQEGHATDGWRVEAMLAHTLGDLGDHSAALPHAARALETAPKEYHDALNQLRAQLQSR